jgi:hypothetical protein
MCAVDSLDRLTGPTCEGPDAAKAVRLPHTRNAPGKAGRPPQRGHPGQSARQDHRPGATQLRRRQAASTPQAPPAGRHPPPGRQGPGDRRRRRRPHPFWTGHASAGASPSGHAAPHDGGHRPCWLPPGATPPIVSSFAVVPRQWVVELTFAWLGRLRWLSKDYETGCISRLLWRSLKDASRGRARSGVPPSPSSSRSAPPSSASPCRSSSSGPAQWPEDNFGLTVSADQQVRDRAQRLG